MPEKVVQGHSLEEIRQEWAVKLKLLPEDITFEIMEKPGFFYRQWKVRLIWNEHNLQAPVITSSQAFWDGTKYVLALGEGVKRLIPFDQVGEIWVNGMLQQKAFDVSLGDQVKFHPKTQTGHLTWELQVLLQGLSVVAKVRHDLAGHYTLPQDLPAGEEIDIAQCTTWESLPVQEEIWDEARLNADLEQLKIVHGLRKGIWSEILAVKGVGEVVIAEATLPVPCQHAQLKDFVGAPQVLYEAAEKSVDFFASKVPLVKEGAVLARKIPGKPGVPGKDVLGKVLPAATFKDFQFCLKKNVCLSADELEVMAACDGQPVRLDERTYMVENVYVLHKDVDLATGSIEFPGDVFIDGNVQDGLRIFAGGKIEIRGSVSHAEIRAEKGAKIHQNLIGGKIVIGENFVVRSQLLRNVSELRDQLSVCLRQTVELIESAGASNIKPGQYLKLVMEKRFPELPKLASQVENFVLDHKDDEMVTEGIIVSIRTAKRFLAGLGPLDLQSLPFLQRVEQALMKFIETISVEIPEKLSFAVSYVQGASIQCGGTFECQKGTYNSDIRVEGDVKIEGVCRGGKIFAGGQVHIRELGGSEVSSTFVQMSSNSRLEVDYCHPHVIIAVGKEIIRLEEAYRQLVIYRKKGQVQVEKIRANPL
ncbi:FapA family protein [Desulfosporosinus metallidurans]|nr:FapA family protein [Desulfosporosinus metallidurans]